VPSRKLELTFASLKYPASAEVASGSLPVFSLTFSTWNQLVFVIGFLCDGGGHNDLVVAVHRNLCIVCLDKALVAPSNIMRESGSVKFRCAFGSGSTSVGSGAGFG